MFFHKCTSLCNLRDVVPSFFGTGSWVVFGPSQIIDAISNIPGSSHSTDRGIVVATFLADKYFELLSLILRQQAFHATTLIVYPKTIQVFGHISGCSQSTLFRFLSDTDLFQELDQPRQLSLPANDIQLREFVEAVLDSLEPIMSSTVWTRTTSPPLGEELPTIVDTVGDLVRARQRRDQQSRDPDVLADAVTGEQSTQSQDSWHSSNDPLAPSTILC